MTGCTHARSTWNQDKSCPHLATLLCTSACMRLDKCANAVEFAHRLVGAHEQALTLGMRVMPPTSSTSFTSFACTPAHGIHRSEST
eukprot:908865-Pelagomonas_calceolata.AAC.4